MILLAACCALATPSWAQDSALSKSISSGWKSVVKETSKAAKSVGKAASDAFGQQKPKRRKSAKSKNDPKATPATAKGEAPSSPPGAATAAKTEPGKDQRKNPSAKPATTASGDDDGPPVPLVVDQQPDQPTTASDKTMPTLRNTNAGTKRLPPPPVAATPSTREATTWTASTVEESGTAIPEATVAPARGSAGAKSSAEPAPAAKPLPITMIPAKAADATAATDSWSKEEIAAAKANCDVILKNVAAVTVPEAPVREGACGAPAPVRLVSLGKNPVVTLSPQPLVTCELVAGLAQWLQNDIQPLAKKHFGASITKIETMSDYSCRMAYGRKGNKLSEHGRANALDIRGFVTGKGETAHVLEQWGKTERDLVAEAARIAAEKAAAEQAAEAAAAAGAKSAVDAVATDATDLSDGETSTRLPPPTMASLGAGPALKPSLHTKAEKAAAAIVPQAPHSKNSQFLRDAHASACRIFGTSLGPESNEAHRNHFHVDMATRKHKKICE